MRSVERPAISAAIAEARDKGDLSENAEYDAAREAQGLLEMRIAKMENTLANARIIDESKIDKSKVQILSKVTLLNHNTKKQVVYTIVAEHEANLREGKLAIGTPIAKALLGHKKGDVVTVEVPAGRSTSKSSTSTSDRGVADETENPLGRSARNVSSYAGSLKKEFRNIAELFFARILHRSFSDYFASVTAAVAVPVSGIAIPSAVARSSMRLIRTSKSGCVENSWFSLLLLPTPASSSICFSRRNDKAIAHGFLPAFFRNS